MEARAVAKVLRVSPRKLRLITGTLRGRRIEEALALLRLLPSPSARLVSKVVHAAAANAENNYQMLASRLRIVRAVVDEGPRSKRFRPRSRGRASPILRRTSHLTVAVAEED